MKALYIALLIFILPFNLFAQWELVNSGTNSHLESVYFINDSVGWCVGNEGTTILKTTNGGTQWFHQVSNVSNWLRDVHFISETTGWVVGNHPNVLIKTTDGGTNWFTLPLPYGPDLYSVFFVSESTGWVVGGDAILKTTNGGYDWVTTYVPIGGDWSLMDVFFISETTGWAVSYDAVFKTTDAGETWGRSLLGTGQWLLSVFFVSETTGWTVGGGASGAGSKIFKTVDGGNIWTHHDIAIGALFSIFFASDSIGWAVGTEGTILKTTDSGNNWGTQISGSNLWLNSVYFVSDSIGWIVGGAGTILKTNNGGGGIITGVKDEIYARRFSLHQNYPNPFNPNTKIKYSIPSVTLRQTQSDIKVSLIVSDVLGREVATLVNEEKPAGNYEEEFNGANLPSGIYFYRLQAGEFVETKKMVLLK